jgi:hypothetical protein
MRPDFKKVSRLLYHLYKFHTDLFPPAHQSVIFERQGEKIYQGAVLVAYSKEPI